MYLQLVAKDVVKLTTNTVHVSDGTIVSVKVNIMYRDVFLMTVAPTICAVDRKLISLWQSPDFASSQTVQKRR